MLRCFLLLLITALTASAQVPVGATRKEVIDQLGWPKSTSGTEEREILNYTDFSILMIDGRVEKLQPKPADGKRPKTKTPPVAKEVPGASKPARKPTPEEVLGPNPDRVDPRPPLVTEQTTQKSRPLNRLPVLPRSDPFAEAKRTVVFMMILFGLLAIAKLWLRAHRKKEKSERDRYSGLAPLAGSVVLPLDGSPRPKAPKPDPLKDGWSLALLKEIEWHRFEQVVAAYECEMGNTAELTDFGPDGGIDVNVFESDSRTLKRVIQCKAFRNQPVGVDLVRAFYGAMTLQKVPQGAFYTTSGFTDDALAIGRENDNLDLVDGLTILNRIQRLALSSQLKLFEVATEGDYTTPTCASCGVKMILRPSGKGRSEGSGFWGCRKYPRCKSTLRMSLV